MAEWKDAGVSESESESESVMSLAFADIVRSVVGGGCFVDELFVDVLQRWWC